MARVIINADDCGERMWYMLKNDLKRSRIIREQLTELSRHSC